MENKPVKRSKHIVKLSHDHHLALMFCWKVRNGLKFKAAPGRIKEYIAYFWQFHLMPHFFEEETILFEPVKDALVQRALDEHQIIAASILALETSNSISTDLDALAALVEKHVRFEERELFPHLEEVLSEAQLEEIGRRIAESHHSVEKDDFSDRFWVKQRTGYDGF